MGTFATGGSDYISYFALASWPLPPDMVYAMPELPSLADYRTKENSVRVLISSGDKIQQGLANMHETERWVKSLDYFIYIDIHQGTCAALADLILPICSRFECDEEVAGADHNHGHLRLIEKVIDPLFESKTEWWLQGQLAKALGLETGLPESCVEHLRWQIENTGDPALAGATLEKALANQGVYASAGIEVPRRAFTDQFYWTSSSKLEVYYESMVGFGQALPSYEPPIEAHDSNPLREKYPLQLNQSRSKFYIHSQFHDATWIQQYTGPQVELNPIDMESRGLKTGDVVEIFNDRGSAACRARANEKVRPGTASVIEGIWSKYLEDGNLQYLTNDTMIERGVALMAGAPVPFNDTLVEVRKA